MPVYEINGHRVEFANEPSHADIDEAARQLGANNQSSQRSDRLSLKSDKPYSSYGYGDALADTGKTVVNSLANLGENTIKTIKSIPQIPSAISQAVQHPISTAGNIIQGFGSKIGEYNSMEKLANKVSTDPFGFGSDAVGAGVLAAGVPGVVKGIGGTSANVGKFFNFDQKALTLGQKVRQVAGAAKQAAVDKFGSSLDSLAKKNPSTTVSLQGIVDGIKNNPDLPYEASSVFKKTPILRDMLKNPGDKGYVSPAAVPLKDTQEIINYINTKIPKSIKANSLDILDVQHDVRAAQLDAFPEMSGVRAEYGKFANDYALVKSALNPKSTPNAIMTNFNNNIAVKDAAKRVLAPVVKDMAKLRGQASTVGWIKKIGLTGLGLETAYEVGRRVVGR